MAILAEFNQPGMTAAQYDRVIQELERQGVGAPDDRSYHFAAPSADGWFVVDVWESQAQLDKFAEVLMPTLQAAGIAAAAPEIRALHNTIIG